MERRRDPRINAGCDVEVLVLTPDGNIPIRGEVFDYSGLGICVKLPRPIQAGTAVRIDVENRMLLGEIVHSSYDGGSYRVGVELQHSATWTRDLIRLVEAINGTAERSDYVF